VNPNAHDARPLPPGWRWARLGEACKQDRQIVEPGSELASRLPYLSLEHIESDTGRILKELNGNVEGEGKSTTFVFDSRHILYGKLRPYLNKVALPDFEGRCTTELIPLLPSNSACREFLAWILRRKETVDAAMSEKTGSRMPRANMEHLLALEIPLPPLPEQRRIAAILTDQLAAVECARAAAQAQLQAAQALPAAYLRAVFDSPEAQRWPKRPLREVCSVHPGQHVLEPDYNRNSIGIGYLTGPADFGGLYPSVTKWTEKPKAWCEPSDVLVTVKGAGVGKVNLAPRERVAIGRQLMAIRPKPDALDQMFLYRVVITHFGELKGDALGSTVPGLGRENIESLEIPMPPLTEQHRIAVTLTAQLDAVERLRQTLQAQLDAINALPAALLRRAFNGEL